jgi:hypothetical protein
LTLINFQRKDAETHSLARIISETHRQDACATLPGAPPRAIPHQTAVNDIIPKNFKSGLEKIIYFCWNRNRSEKIM